MTEAPEGYEEGDRFVLEGTYKVVRRTPLALLVQRMAYDPLWIPESQVHDDSEVYDLETHGKLVVTLWFARKEGWVD
jgi:hypothetical protein